MKKNEIMYENGKYYQIVSEGPEQVGDEYIGDLERDKDFSPQEWTPIISTSMSSHPIEKYTTFIYRRPINPSDIMEEEGQLYVKIYKGRPKAGDQYMGNKSLDKDYFPDEWKDIDNKYLDYHIEDHETLLYRRPLTVRKQSTRSSLPLSSYSIEELMKWRNTASKRIDNIDAQVEYIERVMEEYEKKYNKLMKKRHKDASWVSRLNNALYRKVIKNR